MGASLSYRDIDLMYDMTQGQRGIKAMGPIREWKVVERMLQSGMTRLGTTWGMNILREQQAQIRSAAKGWD
jgi:deoxyribose-phosphate aldolase